MTTFNLPPHWRLTLIVLLPQLLLIATPPGQQPGTLVPEEYHTRHLAQYSFTATTRDEAPQDDNH